MLLKPAAALVNSFFYPLFGRWIFGRTMEEALGLAREMNERGARVSMDYLGEKQDNPGLVQKVVEEYLRLLPRVRESGIKADVCFKLSQLGYDVPGNGRQLCEKNVMAIARLAQENGVFIWVDMETWPYVDYTVGLYKRLLQKFDNVGLCLQANVRRSEKDMIEIAQSSENKPTFRLVKGIYKVPVEHGWQTATEVDAAYEQLIRKAFEHGGIRVAVATHDERFMDLTRALAQKHNQEFQLQMLKGVRTPVQEKLIRGKVPFNVYAPYGKNMFAYCLRRARKAKQELYPRVLSLAFGWIYDGAYGK